MATAFVCRPTAVTVPARPTSACIRCAERKVKCDRQKPCSACVNHKVECVFQPPRPPQKRRRYDREHVQHLTERLKHYESLLQEQGIDPGSRPTRTDSNHGSLRIEKTLQNHISSETPSSEGGGLTGMVSKSQMIHGRGRFMLVDNLWSRVAEELYDPENMLDSDTEDSCVEDAPDDDFNYVLHGPSEVDTTARHPSPEHIHRLWQTFIENVDPLTKVVHVPTIRPLIQKASSKIDSIPRSLEALLFAVYAVAAMSLNDDECREYLGESRKTLLSRYIASTKRALSRAKFMSTTSLLVLQALVLHIISVRDSYEPRAVWSLTGVALRIAQSMGLERDGSSLGLSPFETEMRRRIWWHLKTHDSQAAELCGLSKFRDLDTSIDSTKWPSNVNDNQLYPGMTATPPELEMLTDVAFVALRYELASFATRSVAKYYHQGKCFAGWEQHLSSAEEKVDSDAALKEMEGHLETKYLRYCDPSQPLHLMTMLLARSAINTVKFLTHHPRRWTSISQTPRAERQWVWEICIKLLEQHNMLQSNPQLKRFAWQAASVMQWHAFIHILDTLRVEPQMIKADQVWELIGNTYEHNQAMIMDTRKPLHCAVAILCLKAYDARTATLVSPNNSLCASPTPEYILQLRKQQEIAKTNKGSRPSRISLSKRTVSGDGATNCDMDIGSDARNTELGSTSRVSDIRTAIMHTTDNLQSNSSATLGESFWVLNGLDNCQTTSDIVSLNNDFMIAEDCDGERSDYATISWEQWDTWLAESNIML